MTGGSGFLASWIIKLALDEGFIVHATTRDAAKAEFLKRLDGASERLTIFSGCDLLQEGSFDAAIAGCGTVLHTASPFFMKATDDGMQKLVEPALKGTQAVLDACARLKVAKVVLTSSTAAIYGCYGTKGADHVFSEADWSNEELCLENKNYYFVSKTRAERLAWELAGKDDCPFKLSVMNP